MKNEFYLTLLSNSSHKYFPNNSLANFQTKLPTKLFLSKDWVVGLAEISFNIAESLTEREKPVMIKPRIINISKEPLVDKPVKIPIYMDHVPLNGLLYLMRNAMNIVGPVNEGILGSQHDTFDLEDKLEDIVRDYTTCYCNISEEKMDVSEKPLTKSVNEKLKAIMDKIPNHQKDTEKKICKKHEIILQQPYQFGVAPIVVITIPVEGSEADFKIPLYRNNYESVEDLIKTIILSIPDEIRTQSTLLKIIKSSQEIPITREETNDQFLLGIPQIHPAVQPKIIRPHLRRDLMFVYTDIIKPQLIGNTFARCLRTILLIQNNEVYKSFDSIQYFPLERTNFETIEILITSQDGKAYNFLPSSTPTMLVLHFKKA